VIGRKKVLFSVGQPRIFDYLSDWKFAVAVEPATSIQINFSRRIRSPEVKKHRHAAVLLYGHDGRRELKTRLKLLFSWRFALHRHFQPWFLEREIGP
jgi:hypothetical protein